MPNIEKVIKPKIMVNYKRTKTTTSNIKNPYAYSKLKLFEKANQQSDFDFTPRQETTGIVENLTTY